MASCVHLFTGTARLGRRNYGSVKTVERGCAHGEIQIPSYGRLRPYGEDRYVALHP